MLVVELSALSNTELNRLLAAARSRDQPSLAAELETEITLRAGSASRPQPAQPPMLGAWPMVGIAAAGVLAALVGWTMTRPAALPLPQEPPSLALVVRDAPASTPATAELHPSIAARPQAPETQAVPGPALVAKKPPALNASTSNPCQNEPTPADRLVCGYPSLGAKHRRLREAYLQALAAGADADDLDAGQAEWNVTRSPIANRQRLAEAYATRIGELEAATQAATEAAQLTEPVV